MKYMYNMNQQNFVVKSASHVLLPNLHTVTSLSTEKKLELKMKTCPSLLFPDQCLHALRVVKWEKGCFYA